LPYNNRIMKVLLNTLALFTVIQAAGAFTAAPVLSRVSRVFEYRKNVKLSRPLAVTTPSKVVRAAALSAEINGGHTINKDVKIAIAGGGIGGMALALSLIDAGFHNIDIYEARTHISEVGVGINIQPHAIRELIELGLGDELKKTGIQTAEIKYFHKNGQFIYGEPRGLGAGYKWPQYSIHRGKLLMLLYRAVQKRLGDDRIHTGHKAIDCGSSSTAEGTWVEFQVKNKNIDSYESKKVFANLIIGCDGVHSKIRKRLTKGGAPTWIGITMLRGLTKMKPIFNGRTMMIIGPIENEIVVYPISKEAEDRGETLVNWVALTKTNNEQNLKEEWNVEVEDMESAIAPFLDFKYDFIDVPEMIRNAEAVYKYPMIDRPPLDTWVYGNITLLGDAAHPMLPIGANGATQAIIDGRILALELSRASIMPDALKVYDKKRREAVNCIVKANREESETRFLEIIHKEAPEGFNDLDNIISKEELDDISKQYKTVAGFVPTELNERESYSPRIQRDF